MGWKIEFTAKAKKSLEKLDPQSRKLIKDYLGKVLELEYPERLGKALVGQLKGYWRYRVNKFRIICKIKDDKLIILILHIAKRDVAYNES